MNIIYLIVSFHIIKSVYIQYEILSFDEMIYKLNQNKYTEKEYRNIISNISELLEYYVYLDIAKNPPNSLPKVDLIKEIKSINIEKLKFYDFYLKISNILFSVQDAHLRISFKQLDNYEYYSPIYYYIKTIDNYNYVFLDFNPDNFLNIPFNETLKSEIEKFKQFKIIKINDNNPCDYIQNFGKKLFKSEHAQFTYNLNKKIKYGNFSDYPFIKSDLENITILFENNESIIFEYKIIYNTNKNYERKTPKYNLKWDSNLENKIKYRVDNKNKVNVIYQSSFDIEEYDKNSDYFFRNMLNNINSNNYPIILIEDFNDGGNIQFSYILQSILNYNLSNIKSRESFRVSKKIGIGLPDYFNLFDIETCQRLQLNNLIRNKETDIYENNIEHNRTKIISVYNTYEHILYYTKNYKKQLRKPTEIIIFTDGYSYSATSYFIKDIQESGNAILIGYNGNPSEEKKNDKFDSSQSPSGSMGEVNRILISNLNKYGITMDITIGESFNDNFQNENNIKIPREYIINPIDERSSIYNKYNDDKYNEFINEGLRIINKYKIECNPKNKKLLLLSDSCLFDNNFTHGGFLCDDNGKWSNVCKPSFCDQGYYFDNYFNICKRDPCFPNFSYQNVYSKKNRKMENKFYYIYDNLYLFFIICIIIFVIFLIWFLKVKKRKNKKYFGIEMEDKLI